MSFKNGKNNYAKMPTTDWNGIWKSIDEIEVLDYNSNFSNWIDAMATPGHFELNIEFDKVNNQNNARVNIPTVYPNGIKGNFSIYMGRFEFDDSEIRIWQNANMPIKIKYEINGKELRLELFKRIITFKK